MEKTIEVTEEGIDNIRIDKYLSEYTDIMTRSQLKSRNAVVFINNKKAKLSSKINLKDKITIKYDDIENFDIIPEDIEIDIIYEDKNVIVLNKKQGMVVHPAEGNYTGTLVNGIIYYLKEHRESFKEEKIRPGIVHRLDKETSGVIIIAKNPEVHEYLSSQFRNKTTVKKYFAFIKGRITVKEGKIETFIRRDRINRKKFTADDKEGRFSVTNYKVLKEYSRSSFCLLTPETGRTHQLRVHMAYTGHPILGDPLYSRKNKNFPGITLMLHAYKLEIDIPEKGIMKFIAPLPERFKKILCEKNNQDRFR